MSTRGAYGFKSNGDVKIIFSFNDSHFHSLGQSIVDFIKTINCNQLKKQLKTLAPIIKDKDSKFNDYEHWQNPALVLKNIYTGVYKVYFDAGKFIDNHLFCQYFYLVDLDAKKFNIYVAGDRFLLRSYDLESIPDNWQQECS